jgi:transcriptional regulator with XRE-family HTH domain
MNVSDATTRKTAKKLKEIRLSKRLRQSDVADKANINVNYYAKIERAELKPSVEVYERLAKALKVTSADIFPF